MLRDLPAAYFSHKYIIGATALMCDAISYLRGPTLIRLVKSVVYEYNTIKFS